MKNRKQTEPDKNCTLPPCEELSRLSKKYSRRPEEAKDLIQDLLLEAVRTQQDFTADGFMAWAHGFLRNRAAFVARTEGRRRKREKEAQEKEDDVNLTRESFPETFIETLPPSLMITARLINCGLNKKEIIYLLDVTDSALRQRLTALRKQWLVSKEESGTVPEVNDESTSPFDNGLLRRSLRNSLHGNPDKMVGTIDPDGHLFVIRSGTPHKTDSRGNNKDEKGE